MRLIDADSVLYDTRELGEAWEKFLDSYKAEHRKLPNFGEGINFVHRAIKNAPSVDAEPVVHGRWISHWEDDSFAEPCCFACSECRFQREVDENFGKAIYCPNCGAKMDGGSENEDL